MHRRNLLTALATASALPALHGAHAQPAPVKASLRLK